MSRSSRIALGLCAVLAPPLWACATGAGEDRGRGTDEDGGPTDKPGLRDGGGPDAFGADDIDAATLDVIDGGSSDGGCAGGPVDLLANGNFDGGPGGPWVETSSGGFELILPEGDPDLPFEVTPDSGRFLLYMGGYNDATDAIHQVVSVPADAGGVRLRGAGRIDTDEMLDLPFDQVFIEIASPEGELVEELGRVSNQDATAGQFIPIDLPAAGDLAGRTLQVQLRATTDVSLFTHFFFDTLRLEATTCAGGAGLAAP